jgi:hypothetical protein
MSWGTREEMLRFCVLQMLNRLPADLAILCDQDTVDEFIKLHDSILDEKDLKVLTETLRKDYDAKIKDIKAGVADILCKEMLISEGSKK